MSLLIPAQGGGYIAAAREVTWEQPFLPPALTLSWSHHWGTPALQDWVTIVHPYSAQLSCGCKFCMLTFHLPCKEDNSWGISMRTSLRSEKYKLLTPLNPHFSINTLMTNTGKLISIDSLSRLSAVGKKKKENSSLQPNCHSSWVDGEKVWLSKKELSIIPRITQKTINALCCYSTGCLS